MWQCELGGSARYISCLCKSAKPFVSQRKCSQDFAPAPKLLGWGHRGAVFSPPSSYPNAHLIQPHAGSDLVYPFYPMALSGCSFLYAAVVQIRDHMTFTSLRIHSALRLTGTPPQQATPNPHSLASLTCKAAKPLLHV